MRLYARLARRFSDRFVLRMANGDERLARSLTHTAFAHLLLILLTGMPTLMRGFGCVEPYELPGGERPSQARQVQVQVQRRQRVVVNPRAEVAFNMPKPEEVQLNLDEMTMAARAGTGTGGRGFGGEGSGMIRFIRLRYSGGDWDYNMKHNAGTNMLHHFNRLTGIPAARAEEAINIQALTRFPKDKSPPFVYITGSSGRMNISSAEVRALREYLLERGGMIFADNGGGRFHHDFTSLMNSALEGVSWRWIEIPNDDIIYRAPFVMDGAPPLWHHSGWRALGIRREGRWIIFYHQGDISDAWKDGHSGTSPTVWEHAFKCGVNVINYAVDRYMDHLERENE